LALRRVRFTAAEIAETLGMALSTVSGHERTAALDGWLHHYNHHRRHSALSHQPPVTRTNVLGTYT
jgi:transposase InsO family protein